MKHVVAMLCLASPLAAMAADSTPDTSFYKNAAESGITEVDAGNLAQQKGNSQAVKDFGAMMVKDHTEANDKLKTLAMSKNVSLPTSGGVMAAGTKAKLDMESGDTFDKGYITSQIHAHKVTIALFKKEISNGKDPEAQAFATATLPTLQAHLKKIDAIATDAGVSTK